MSEHTVWKIQEKVTNFINWERLIIWFVRLINPSWVIETRNIFHNIWGRLQHPIFPNPPLIWVVPGLYTSDYRRLNEKLVNENQRNLAEEMKAIYNKKIKIRSNLYDLRTLNFASRVQFEIKWVRNLVTEIRRILFSKNLLRNVVKI